MLLCEIALQTENKLARLASPGLTPKSAKHMTFSRLSKGCYMDVNRVVLQQVVSKYPGLEDGLESLKDISTHVTHTRVQDASKRPVTVTLLRALIDAEYLDGDPVKPDVEAVLCCLTDLAEELGESLFVPTT